jgi:hypothetical protein
MKSANGGAGRRLSSAWSLQTEGKSLVFRRISDETTLTIAARTAASAAKASSVLAGLFTEQALGAALGLDRSERDVLSTLCAYDVHRAADGRATPSLRGGGVVHDAFARAIAEGGWRLPPMYVADEPPRRPPSKARRAEVAAFACAGGIVAVLAAAKPCAWCLCLRRLARWERKVTTNARCAMRFRPGDSSSRW